DLAAHGVLRKGNAALFVEYDGYYRHLEPAGLVGDMRKTEALLRFAPAGSVVVRIAHEQRDWEEKSVDVVVDCWPTGHGPSVLKAGFTPREHVYRM
ncbi:Mterfd1, partial [Symbiodinium pilosum]